MDQNMQNILISAGTSFTTALAAKGIKGPTETLDDLWELIFGSFHLYVEKKRAQHEKDLTDYKNLIANEVAKIPENSFQEPPLIIVGPALEASKYYIESNELRSMFAKIVSASMDKRKNGYVHSSYVDIIKQISPLDAQNLMILKGAQRPIAEYSLSSPNGVNSVPWKTNIFLSNPTNTDISENAISMSNLLRLGLVSIDYTKYINFPGTYDSFSDTKEYKELSSRSDTSKQAKESLSRMGREVLENHFPPDALNFIEQISELTVPKITKGIVILTPIGASFTKICC